MSLVTYRVIPNSYVYGFSRMDDEVAEACSINTKKAHELGIDLEFRVGFGGYHFEIASGVVFVNGQHYRGRLQGRRITIHSGWNPATRSYGRPVFSSITGFSQLLWHETNHAWDGHTSDGNCLMHPIRANWPCPVEVQRFKQRFGTYTPQPAPEPLPDDQSELSRLKALRREMARQRDEHYAKHVEHYQEYARLKKEVGVMNQRIKDLEQTQESGHFSLAASVPMVCCPWELN